MNKWKKKLQYVTVKSTHNKLSHCLCNWEYLGVKIQYHLEVALQDLDVLNNYQMK